MSLDRATLLATCRPTLARLLHRADQGRLGPYLAAYVISVCEPTGYMVALALQRRYGRPDPDSLLRLWLEADRPQPPILFGVTSRRILAELLEDLSPRLGELAAELRRAGRSRSSAPVLVAASGGAEIVPIDLDKRVGLHSSKAGDGRPGGLSTLSTNMK